MAVRIEDAGFEIRDMIAWVYWSWFPKSLNIGKAVDKLQGNEREVVGIDKNAERFKEYKEQDGCERTTFNDKITKGTSEWEWRWTALKPALESITLAQKSFDFSSVLDILIKDNLYILRKELCQFPLCVWIAEKHLQLNQQEQEGNVSQSIAEWIAEKNINIQEDLPVVIDMLQSLLIENTNWNIVLWWLSILVELYNQTNTYITETKISLTTDLIILNSYEFESIYQSIIQAKDNQTNELTASVYNVELLFKGLQLKLKTIQEHFAQECAISRAGDDDLLPNLSPIIMSRKPLWEKTVAENVLKYGTGGINIDGSRVGHNEETKTANRKQRSAGWNSDNCGFDSTQNTVASADPSGRFPANFIHDGSDEVVELFPQTKSGGGNKNSVNNQANSFLGTGFGGTGTKIDWKIDSGSASRFFYCAKASKSERNRWCEELEEKQYSHDGRETPIENAYQRNDSLPKNHHPTVKPIALMKYLVKLVTPPNWIVFDPFTWSWSTLIGAKELWYSFIWCEMSEEYVKIAEARLSAVVEEEDDSSKQVSLFSE